jgi:branched-chain amino acid transport system ATP-binding protein
MLRVEGIVAGYGGMVALEKVSIVVGDGDFISIVGPNGAGKSTILKVISGTVQMTDGSVFFNDTNITYLPAHKRTELGIIHVPEGRRIFPSLTVMENLEIGAYRSGARDSANKTLEIVLEYFPILRERQSQLGGTLSGGEQQMLAISRGLMAKPSILMLDEPSLGLSPRLTEVIFEAIKDLRGNLKFSILLVEQRAVEALELCDCGYILESGRITMSGNRQDLMGNPVVQRAYLGCI